LSSGILCTYPNHCTLSFLKPEIMSGSPYRCTQIHYFSIMRSY
jgi:hypothetical protein